MMYFRSARFFLAATLVLVVRPLSAAEPQVLFALMKQGDGPVIEPIAMVTKTPRGCAGCWALSFAEPPRGDETDEAFRARYFRPGRTYRWLDSGAEVGTARVKKGDISLGCVSLVALVDLTPALPKNSWGGLGLAIGSMHITPRPAVTDDTTPAEEQALINLAKVDLRRRGVPSAQFAKMTRDVFAVDLNGDGKRDLIGSFELPDPDRHSTRHLFLIAFHNEGDGYTTQYAGYDRSLLDDGGRSILVDTLDLDEDGVDEVIVRTDGKEGYSYEILKRGRDGRWKSVYRGGGSGC